MGTSDDPRARIKTNAGRFSVQSNSAPHDAASSNGAATTIVGDSSCFKAVEMEQIVSLPADMMRKKGVEVLRVEGDSMIGDHLLNGDLLIIEKRDTAKDATWL